MAIFQDSRLDSSRFAWFSAPWLLSPRSLNDFQIAKPLLAGTTKVAKDRCIWARWIPFQVALFLMFEKVKVHSFDAQNMWHCFFQVCDLQVCVQTRSSDSYRFVVSLRGMMDGSFREVNCPLQGVRWWDLFSLCLFVEFLARMRVCMWFFLEFPITHGKFQDVDRFMWVHEMFVSATVAKWVFFELRTYHHIDTRND